MPGHTMLSYTRGWVYGRRQSVFAVAGHGELECRAGKTGNLPVFYLLQIWIILFYIVIFMHEINSDRVDLKDFYNLINIIIYK